MKDELVSNIQLSFPLSFMSTMVNNSSRHNTTEEHGQLIVMMPIKSVEVGE
jgi:hypothetical protein